MTLVNSAWIEKIEIATRDGSLGKSKYLVENLSCWKYLEKEEDVEAYIKGLLSSKDGLFEFLNGITSYPSSGGRTITKLIENKTIKYFNVEEALKKSINELDENTLTEEEREILEMYRNRPEDWMEWITKNEKDRAYESLDKGENPMNPS